MVFNIQHPLGELLFRLLQSLSAYVPRVPDAVQ